MYPIITEKKNKMTSSTIRINGASEHNLKNINLTLPRNKLVVITGPSGSGKSTLAFDTLYAEGQRRYVESLSAYARQFLEVMKKPEVQSIEGLSPAIAIEQKTTGRNPRSTVGTVTEIYDYLRLLFAHVGVAYSPATGKKIAAQSVSEMVDRILTQPKGKRFYLLAPIIKGRKGSYKKELQEFAKRGFQRVRIDGTLHDIHQSPTLDSKRKHDIDLVVDRLVIDSSIKERLADSLETALNESGGIAWLLPADDGDTQEPLIFSSQLACPVSGFAIDELSPRLFSFNSPHGACRHCSGLGVQKVFDPLRVIPNEHRSIEDDAIAPWQLKRFHRRYRELKSALITHYAIAPAAPWREIDESVRHALLHGEESPIELPIHYGNGAVATAPFHGILTQLQRDYDNSDRWQQDDLNRYLTDRNCPHCEGKRLCEQALAVKIDHQTIADVCDVPIDQCAAWIASLTKKLSAKQQEIGERLLLEIGERLHFLSEVGLNYLTLARHAASLSGGEGQRIRLASQIGSGLTGVLYVLDEPSIGLHQRDNARLLATLKRLRDLGNSVIVVEHDEDTIRTADHVVDMGPAAGNDGGFVMDEGTPAHITRKGKGLTAQYLRGDKKIAVPKQRRPTDAARAITIRGARGHNLQTIDATFPLGCFICVTGVSGSGKSTLVIDTLYEAVQQTLARRRTLDASHYQAVEGLQWVDKVVDIDQSPIGRTPRSNPATYTGAFGPIRDWYAQLPLARSRGYKPGRFSFNVKGGRCEHCGGEGMVRIEMHFLPDVYVECEHCKGHRFGRETLQVLWRKKSIADVLAMTVDEAFDFFRAITAVKSKLELLHRVGLGYITLGQQATTLSGGEAQRIRLAKELSRRATGRTLYILDEPTTGLHFDDVAQLLTVLHELVGQGNSVVVIEHNLDVIKTADWILDLGPEGGDGGGRIIASGTPETIAKDPHSHTGRFLKKLL